MTHFRHTRCPEMIQGKRCWNETDMEALSKIYANRTEFYQTLIIGQFYPL